MDGIGPGPRFLLHQRDSVALLGIACGEISGPKRDGGQLVRRCRLCSHRFLSVVICATSRPGTSRDGPTFGGTNWTFVHVSWRRYDGDE